MGRKTILVDDLDGSEATRTILFAIDGKEYEIDLSDKNAIAFEKVIEKYVAVAHQPEKKPSPTRSAPLKRDYDPAEIRTWAVGKGIPVAPRGRVAQKLVDEFKADQAATERG